MNSPDWHPFRKFWENEAFVEQYREKCLDTLKQEFGSANFYVLKDPRLCRTLPFWLRILKESGATPRVLLPVRNPLEVAYSLKKRDRFTISFGLLLWLTYVLDAEAYSRGCSRAVVNWVDFLFDWRLAMQQAGEHLGMEWPYQSIRAIAETDMFLSEDLRHNSVSDADFEIHPDVNDWVKRTYHALQQLAHDPHATESLRILDEVRVEFYRATEIFGRILLTFEKQGFEFTEANRALQERSCTETERCLALEGEIRGISEHRDRLAAEIADYAERWPALDAERGHLRHTLEQVQAERDRIAAEANHHAERARSAEEERDHLRHMLGQTQTERDQIAAEANHHVERARATEEERDHLRHVLGQTQTERDQIAAEANHHAERARAAEEERDHLRHTLGQTQTERDQIAAEANHHAERTRAAEEERDHLRHTLGQVRSERDQFAEDADRLVQSARLTEEQSIHLSKELDTQKIIARQAEYTAVERDRIGVERDRLVSENEHLAADIKRKVEDIQNTKQEFERVNAALQRASQRNIFQKLLGLRGDSAS